MIKVLFVFLICYFDRTYYDSKEWLWMQGRDREEAVTFSYTELFLAYITGISSTECSCEALYCLLQFLKVKKVK